MAGFLKEDETFTHVIAIDFGTGASGYGITQKHQDGQDKFRDGPRDHLCRQRRLDCRATVCITDGVELSAGARYRYAAGKRCGNHGRSACGGRLSPPGAHQELDRFLVRRQDPRHFLREG